MEGDILETWIQTIITVICAFAASSGFWALITRLSDRKDAKTRMLIGLGHDRILYLGRSYIKRGSITSDEYENLHNYLYEPYEEMGGNGSAKRVMKEVDKLPIKEMEV